MNKDVPQGRCSNLPHHCELAKAGTLQDMPSPAAGCSECGMALMDGHAESLRGAFPRGLVVGAIAALLLLVGAFAGYSTFFGKPPQTATVTPAAPASGSPAAAEAARRDVLESYLLRLAGSNTIGAKLAPEVSEAWLRALGASDVEVVRRRDDQGVVLPEAVVSGKLDGGLVGVEIKAYGAATGADALRDGAADVWMASSPVSDEQAQALKDLGDMRAPDCEHVVALDGVAIIVSPKNPLSALTRAQAKGLFSGAVKDWSALRLPAGPVKLYARDKDSGTRQAFQEMILGQNGDVAPFVATKSEEYAESEQLSDDVAADPHGLGFVGMAFVGASKALAIKDGDEPALAPTAFAVRTESYPLSRRLYLYSAAHPSSEATRFLVFALSEAGQTVVRKSAIALIPTLRLAAEADGRPCRLSARYPGAKQEFCDLRARALALDASFHFRDASLTLDSLAAADLDRAVEALKQKPEARVILAGFADGRGDYKESCRRSKEGAEAVKQGFVGRGIGAVEARGFCAELPVRDNAGPEFELNRRVEVYVVEPAGAAKAR